jgi:putative ABC transport system substrate-binding protein
MRRREFITLFLSAAAAWPLAARAQPSVMASIGFLGVRSPTESAHLLAAFHKGLTENGYIEGRNLGVEYRWADGQYDRLSAMAGDLVDHNVAVIFAGGAPAVPAAIAATTRIPIVFMTGDDPVKAGFVASLNRPGGNLTGITLLTAALESKRFGLLHDLGLRASSIGVLLNPNYPAAAGQLSDIEKAARANGRCYTFFGAAPIRRSMPHSNPLLRNGSLRSWCSVIRSSIHAVISLSCWRHAIRFLRFTLA